MLKDGVRTDKDFLKKFLVSTFFTMAVVLVTVLRFIFIDELGKSMPSSYGFYIGFGVGLAALCVGMLLLLYSVMDFGELKLKEQSAILFTVFFSYVISTYISLASIYLMPVFLAGLILSQLSQKQYVFVANTMVCIFVGYTELINFVVVGENAISLLVVIAAGLVCGGISAITLSGDVSRLRFFVKSFIVCAFSLLTTLFFYVVKVPSVKESLMYTGFAALGQFIMGIVLSPVLERMFNLLTNSRLLELTDISAPLMKRLLKDAPGTYNHSAAVASFAQMCAAEIGVNPYLARACAYYHDVGKLANPMYFKENQSFENLHDSLLPEVSAEILRSHTEEGLKLCNEYKIPEEISHVTIQHHGTTLISVFYNKAQKMTDSPVDIYEYRYHGVTPRTKVAAIIMMCDCSEAAIRAMDKPDGDKVDKLLRKLTLERLENGQFDNCDITINELNRIREIIVKAYGGLFHQRVKYPEGK